MMSFNRRAGDSTPYRVADSFPYILEHIIDNNEKTGRKLLMTLTKVDYPISRIRKMHRDDLDTLERIRESAGWNQTEADWKRLMHLEPEGCFVMVEKDKVNAATTLIGFNKTLAWIGMVLVDEKHRGRGIATRLVQHALNYARDQSFKTIRLDATPQGQPVYKKLGFTLDWNLNRWQIDDLSHLPEVNIRNSGLQVHSRSDGLDALFALDNKLLKIDRSALLSNLAQASHSVVSACNSEGKLKGYGMLRSGSFADYLGPIICSDPHYGPPLVSCLLKHRRQHRIVWDIPEINAKAEATGKSLGFNPKRPLIRMSRGPGIPGEKPELQWAISDPSTG